MQLEEDYFKRDLSEAEEAELAEKLQASPELAERFARLAEADGARLGQGSLSKPLLWSALAGAGLLGLAITAGQQHRAVGLFHWASAPSVSTPAAEGKASEAPRHRHIPAKHHDSQPSVARSTQDPASTTPRPAIPQGGRLEVGPSAQGGFVARLSSGEAVAYAEVRDMNGRHVASMHGDGNGGALWDAQVAPGRYQIVAGASGAAPLTRWVEIEGGQP
jgi:hypothetical protein